MDKPRHNELLKILERIDRPGTFCANGLLPAIIPGLEVEDVGPVALPLQKKQAESLKKRAHQAPYGKGTETLVDTNVRRVWEIDSNQVVLANPEWQDVVQEAVTAAQSELGLKKQNLTAHLYKLLLYEPESFFLSHRDGEKLDRMVATLVIVLPSKHEGGELIVRHEGREEIVDFAPQSRFQTQYAAFYADCEHEIRPVTSGHRLALVYNLTLEKSRRTITAPTSGEHIAAAAELLRQWSSRNQDASDSSADSPPSKLAVILDHQYTKAGLTYDALKGVDRGRAGVLFAAAQESGWDASLALVTYWESGSAEPSGDYGYGYGRRRYWDDDFEEDAGDHIMGEVFDSSLTARHFCDAEGNSLAFDRIPLDEDEIVSKKTLTEEGPDKEDFEGFTGNAGMTLERWYRRAAVVLWPAETRFDVLCEAGVQSAVGGLDQMVRQWKQAKKTERDVLKKSCRDFASRIIAHWPEREFASDFYARPIWDYFDDEDFDDDWDVGERGSRRQGKTQSRDFLALLKELGEAGLISEWIRGVLAKDASADPGKTLGDLCKKHGWSTFRTELLEVFENTSNETLERHARLLADWSLRKDKDADRIRLCSEAARRIMPAMECWDPQKAKRSFRAKSVDPGTLLPLLVQAFLKLEEPELLDRLVADILDRPKVFDLTTIQIPAILGLGTWLKRNVKQPQPALERWLKAILDELESRAADPPQEPTDWRRKSATGCNCADCQELRRFLKDPHTETLRLPLAKHRRQHLHQVIDRNKLDTTHTTERRGRPYALICTKTKASYERALKAHQVDLDHRAKIRKLADWHEQLEAQPTPRKRQRKKTSKRGPS